MLHPQLRPAAVDLNSCCTIKVNVGGSSAEYLPVVLVLLPHT